MRYLHEKVGEESMIDGGGSEGRGEMLQASKLQPPCHDNVANISAVVQQRCYGRGIALRNLHGHSRGAANVVEVPIFKICSHVLRTKKNHQN